MAKRAVRTEERKTASVEKPAASAAADAVKTTVEETTREDIQTEKPVTPVKKAEEKKAAAKKPAEKKQTGRKPAEMKTSFCVQYLGKEVFEKDMIAAAKKAWTAKKNKVSDIRTLELYVKPEDNAVYYVINEDFKGSFSI